MKNIFNKLLSLRSASWRRSNLSSSSSNILFIPLKSFKILSFLVPACPERTCPELCRRSRRGTWYLKIRRWPLRRQVVIVALGLIILFAPLVYFLALHPGKTEASWFDHGWEYRKKLSFDNTAQAENLANFPVMVKLNSANFNFSQARDDGYDIRFTDSDGATLLSYEKESYDRNTQTAIFWVKVPQIDASSSTDSVYIYWGAAGAVDGQDASNTWNSNYKGVWHMDDDNATTIVTDSTTNANNLTSIQNTNIYGETSGQIANSFNIMESVIPKSTSSISAVHPSIQLDSNNYPVIAYLDNTNSDLVLIHCNDVNCAGNDESLSVVDTSGVTGLYPSLQLDSLGKPMITYFNDTDDNLLFVHCNDVNCAGGDETITTLDSTNATGYYPYMLLDSVGYPVIAYYYSTGGDVKLIHCGNADCTSGNSVVSVDTTDSVGNYYHGITMVLDANWFPVLAYYDTTTLNLRITHCNDVNCAGADESMNNISVGTDTVGRFNAIKLDASGNPMVAFANATDSYFYFLHCDDANCAGTETPIRMTAGTYPWMQLNASGNPVISCFYSLSPKIITCANTNCSSYTTTIVEDQKTYSIVYPSFVFDSNYNPVLVDYASGFYSFNDIYLYNLHPKIKQAYDADFNFGTGNFSVSTWFKSNGRVDNGYLLSHYDLDQGYKVGLDYGGHPFFAIDDDSSWSPDAIATVLPSGVTTNVDNSQTSALTGIDMALDGSGYPIIANVDDTGDDLEFVHCNDTNCSGGNETKKVLDSATYVRYFVDMTLTSNSAPVITYYDYTNTDLKMARCDDSDCTNVTLSTVVASANAVGIPSSIVLDTSGFPVIAYYDATATDLMLIHCNDLYCAGGDDTPVAVDNTGSVGSFMSLKLDGSGYPMIAYYYASGLDLKYAHCTDVNCSGSITKTSPDSTGDVGSYTKLVLDDSGNPVIAYRDTTNLRLKLTHCADTDCSLKTVNFVNDKVNAGYAPYRLNLGLNDSGNPVIAHTWLTSYDTIISVCNDANCAGGDETDSLLRASPRSDTYVSLALDSNDYPIVAFYNNNDLQLLHSTSAIYSDTNAKDDSAWHHLVAVKNNATSIKVYIDGVESATANSLAATLTSDSAELHLGEDYIYGNSIYNWNGQMDEVQIDNTARSAAWVAAQYKSESNTFVTFGETQTDPIVYWALDEGYGNYIKDSTGNNYRGTLGSSNSAPTWTTEDQCVSGKCLHFDGSNDFVSIDSTVNDIKTVAFWVNPSSTTQPFIEFYNNASIFASAGTVGTSGFSGITIYVNGVASTTITANTWQHIEISATSGINGTAINIGKVGANYLNGFIDDIKIYSYPRSAAQIKTDYNSRGSSAGASVVVGAGLVPALSNGLVGYWKMDETTGTSAVDSSGNSNTGTLGTGNSAPGWVGGMYGNGLSFDGGNDYVGIGTTSSFSFEKTDPFSVCGWFKRGRTGTIETLVSKQASSAPYRGWRIMLYDDNTLTFGLFNDSVSNVLRMDTVNTFTLTSSWYHFCTTYDGLNTPTGIKIFINGTTQTLTTNSNTLTSTIITSTPFNIGTRANGSFPFLGLIDEVRIYNRALSPAEIQTLYNWAPGPVGWWKMDEKTGSTAYDSSGNNNNAAFAAGNSAPTWTTGKYGGALSFDGSNDYVKTNLFAISGSDRTFELWMKTPGTVSYESIVNQNSSETNTASKYTNGLQGKNATPNTISLIVGDGTNADSVDFSITPYLNQWIHLVGVIKGNNEIRIYINGISVANKNITISPEMVSRYVVIGRIDAKYFNGFIDDVRIYNYARSSKQIVEDMLARQSSSGASAGGNAGSQVGYWKFDEGYGTTAKNIGFGGSAINGTFGTGNSAPTWTNDGKFGKALDFEAGNSNYINAGNDTGLKITGSLTLSAWIKIESNGAYQIHGKQTNTAGGYSYALQYVSGVIRGGISSTGSNWIYRDSSNTYGIGSWVHTVMVYNSVLQTIDIYVNGTKDNGTLTGTVPSSIYDSSTPVLFGARGDATTRGLYFDGLIDEVKIYNSALTAEEVKLDYNRGSSMVLGSLSSGAGNTAPATAASQEYCVVGDTAPCSSPVAEWKMDEKTSTIINDSTGNGNSGSFGAGNSAPTWTVGKFGSGLKFDGSNDYTAIAHNSTLNLGNNFTLEAWIKPNVLNSYQTIWGKIDGAGDGVGIRILNTNNTFSLWGTSSNSDIAATSNILTTGQWSFISATVDGSTARLYNNGLGVGSTNWTTIAWTNTKQATIGSRNDILQQFFNGSIDQVRVFNYARTPAQIAWDYNRGKPVGWWKLDECQGTTTLDSSGIGNSGLITIGAGGSQTSVGTCSTSGTAWESGATGKYNSSLNLDGTDDRILITGSSALDPTAQITLSAWVYPNVLNRTEASIITKYDGASSADDSWILRVANTAPAIYFRTADGTNWNSANCPSIASTNTWNHVVATFDGANIRCYLNGKSGTPSAKSDAIRSNPTEPIYIGSSSMPDQYFQGQLDDVRIFNYSLTSEQVKQIYNESAIRFGPSSGPP